MRSCSRSCRRRSRPRGRKGPRTWARVMKALMRGAGKAEGSGSARREAALAPKARGWVSASARPLHGAQWAGITTRAAGAAWTAWTWCGRAAPGRLKKSGRDGKGVPFHARRRPASATWCRQRIFHCLGCGATGDAIKFRHGSSTARASARRRAALRGGVDSSRGIPRRRAAGAAAAALAEVNEKACVFY